MFRELEILTLARRGLSMLGLVAVLFVFFVKVKKYISCQKHLFFFVSPTM